MIIVLIDSPVCRWSKSCPDFEPTLVFFRLSPITEYPAVHCGNNLAFLLPFCKYERRSMGQSKGGRCRFVYDGKYPYIYSTGRNHVRFMLNPYRVTYYSLSI